MNELVQTGVEITTQKRDLSKEMNELAKERARKIGLKKKQLINIKDYKHYYGAGWGADALDRDKEEKCPYPDRVSPTFRKLVEIVSTLRDADMVDFLTPYLEACAARGIKVAIEPERTEAQEKVNKALLDRTLEEMDALQCEICQLNDRIHDELAPQAEAQKYVHKSKFKSVVEHAYKITVRDSDTDKEKIDEEIEKNTKYNTAIAEIREEK